MDGSNLTRNECNDSSESEEFEISGVVFAKLTSENLRLHQQAAAILHANKKLNEKRATRPAEWGRNPPNIRPTPSGKSNRIKRDFETYERKIECLIKVFLAALWCVQLFLSLSATALGPTTNEAWIAVYISGGIALLASLLILSQKSYPRKLRRSPRKDTLREWEPFYGFNRNVYLFVETIRGIAASICLFMHGTALAVCRGDTDPEWFLTSDDRVALCQHKISPKLIPLVVIEAILLFAAILRIFLSTLKVRMSSKCSRTAVRETTEIYIAQ
jgi:hypothetical protein